MGYKVSFKLPAFLFVCFSFWGLPSYGENVPQESDLPSLIQVTNPNPINIRINVPERKLYLYKSGLLEKTYSVAVGQGRHPTPIRDFRIEQIIWNPWWIPPKSDWAKNAKATPPGPHNPLGPVKMKMQEAILIHGTNKPKSIGFAASHGCIRMLPKDAKELAWFIQSHMTGKNTAEFQEKYTRNSRTSFYVNLPQSVPVSITYDRVELKDKQIVIHQDVYWRKGNLLSQIEEVLRETGLKNFSVNKDKLKSISKELKNGSVAMSIEELIDGPKMSSL